MVKLSIIAGEIAQIFHEWARSFKLSSRLRKIGQKNFNSGKELSMRVGKIWPNFLMD